MRTVFCRVLKPAAPGDEVRICYTTSRGGMTEAACKLNEADFWQLIDSEHPLPDATRETRRYEPKPDSDDEPAQYYRRSDAEVCEAIASSLAGAISRQWAGEMFSCKARRDEVIITTSADDTRYFTLLNGVEDRSLIAIEQ